MTLFRVNWHFHSGDDIKNRFLRGGHLGFWIRTILTCFFYPPATILPTKFRDIWPLGSGKDVQTRFSRWWQWQQTGFRRTYRETPKTLIRLPLCYTFASLGNVYIHSPPYYIVKTRFYIVW